MSKGKIGFDISLFYNKNETMIEREREKYREGRRNNQYYC